MNVRMPDGTIVKNVPDDITQEELLQFYESYKSNKPSKQEEPSFFDELVESGVNLLPDIGGMGGAILGAKIGAAGGSIVPVAGTAVGALIGSAIGAFSGAGAGESARQLIEGESDPLKAVNRAALEGALDIGGAKAFKVISGAKDVALGFIGYSDKAIKSLPTSEVAALTELQRDLGRAGTTLRPSQIAPASARVTAMESVAEGGIGSKKALEGIAEAQSKYVDDEVTKILDLDNSLDGLELGDLIQSTVKNARLGSAETYTEAFGELSKKYGEVPVNLFGIRQKVSNWKKGKLEGLTKRWKEKASKEGSPIPFTSAELTKVVNDVLKLSPKSNFDTSFDKLKDLKKTLTALVGNPATKNDPAVGELTNIVKAFEATMLKSADKHFAKMDIPDGLLEPPSGLYRELMKQYNSSQDVLYSSIADSLLKNNKPEKLGDFLSSVGEVTPYKEMQKIMKEGEFSADYIKKVNDSIESRFLSGFISDANGLTSLDNLAKKLSDPRFSETFNEVVKPQTKANLMRLVKQADILSRGIGGEAALAVKSAQFSGARGVVRGEGGATGFAVNLLKVLTPSRLAKISSNPDVSNRLLGILKQVEKAPAGELPQDVKMGLATLMAYKPFQEIMRESEQEEKIKQEKRLRLLEQVNADKERMRQR